MCVVFLYFVFLTKQVLFSSVRKSGAFFRCGCPGISIYRRILKEKLLDCKTDTPDIRETERVKTADIQKVNINSIKNQKNAKR